MFGDLAEHRELSVSISSTGILSNRLFPITRRPPICPCGEPSRTIVCTELTSSPTRIRCCSRRHPRSTPRARNRPSSNRCPPSTAQAGRVHSRRRRLATQRRRSRTERLYLAGGKRLVPDLRRPPIRALRRAVPNRRVHEADANAKSLPEQLSFLASARATSREKRVELVHPAATSRTHHRARNVHFANTKPLEA